MTNYTGTGIHQPSSITSGPDGALWFTNYSGPGAGHGSIGRITTSGTVSDFTGSGIRHPAGITTGPDGALWFTSDGVMGSIGRITPSGTISTYSGRGIGEPASITAGPDGALWFNNGGGDEVGRITTSGTVSIYSGPGADVVDITTGPDGALWFTNYDNAIGRVTVPAPELASFSPTSGAVGTSVTITGTALEGASSVTIGGVGAAMSEDTATRIKLTVPSGANSGKVEVTTPSGTGVSTKKFTVLSESGAAHQPPMTLTSERLLLAQ